MYKTFESNIFCTVCFFLFTTFLSFNDKIFSKKLFKKNIWWEKEKNINKKSLKQKVLRKNWKKKLKKKFLHQNLKLKRFGKKCCKKLLHTKIKKRKKYCGESSREEVPPQRPATSSLNRSLSHPRSPPTPAPPALSPIALLHWGRSLSARLSHWGGPPWCQIRRKKKEKREEGKAAEREVAGREKR